MKLGMANKPVKPAILVLLLEAVAFGLTYLTYILFESDPSAPFLATALFFFLQTLALLFLILFNKQFFGLGLALKSYKNTGIVAFLLNASRQLHIYVGPYNYSFKYQTKKGDGPEFPLRLGSAVANWGGIPVHFGVDSSFTSVDIESIAHQQLVNAVYDGPKFKLEMLEALKKSESPHAKKLLEDSPEGALYRERVFSIDLNSIFPMRTMHYEYAGELIATHQTGKNETLLRAFVQQIQQNKIFLPIMAMLVLMLGAAVFSYQAMQNTSDLSVMIDGLTKATAQGLGQVKDLVATTANEVAQNQDLIPKKTVITPGG